MINSLAFLSSLNAPPRSLSEQNLSFPQSNLACRSLNHHTWLNAHDILVSEFCYLALKLLASGEIFFALARLMTPCSWLSEPWCLLTGFWWFLGYFYPYLINTHLKSSYMGFISVIDKLGGFFVDCF